MIELAALWDLQFFILNQMPKKKMPQFMDQCCELHGRSVILVNEKLVMICILAVYSDMGKPDVPGLPVPGIKPLTANLFSQQRIENMDFLLCNGAGCWKSVDILGQRLALCIKYIVYQRHRAEGP